MEDVGQAEEVVMMIAMHHLHLRLVAAMATTIMHAITTIAVVLQVLVMHLLLLLLTPTITTTIRAVVQLLLLLLLLEAMKQGDLHVLAQTAVTMTAQLGAITVVVLVVELLLLRFSQLS